MRTNDGFRVLEDNLRVPSGVSYMIANRKAVKASLRRLYRSSRVQEVEHYGHDFISQPVLALSRAPCLIDGRVEPRHVDLRPFVLHGHETRIVPGAFCRVALRRGSLVVNSSQGGGGEDLWVLGD